VCRRARWPLAVVSTGAGPGRGVSLAVANVVTPYFVRVVHAVQRFAAMRRFNGV